MATVKVSQLSPGQVFRVTLLPGQHVDYRLLRVSPSRAYVEPLARSRQSIRKKDEFSDLTGRDEIVTEFDSTRGRHNISAGTECIILDEDGDEDLAGPRRTPVDTISRTAVVNKMLGTSRKKAPKPLGSQPLNPDTKRGKLVAMFSKNKTIAQVCEALGINRGCAMSHLSDSRKFNGVQYEIAGEKVKIMMPAGGASDDDASDIL